MSENEKRNLAETAKELAPLVLLVLALGAEIVIRLVADDDEDFDDGVMKRLFP